MSMEKKMQHQGSMKQGHYVRLSLMILLSFVSMYILMYAMANRLENVYPNLNQFYMAGLMAAPMLVIELVLMGAMYQNKKLTGLLMAAGVIAALAFWFLIRQQVAITDRQFLKSMIPHHAGAILMCEQQKSKTPKILQLCDEIITSQRTEIGLMKALLEVQPAVASTAK
jgi:small-conductance mechanosensitive channel